MSDSFAGEPEDGYVFFPDLLDRPSPYPLRRRIMGMAYPSISNIRNKASLATSAPFGLRLAKVCSLFSKPISRMLTVASDRPLMANPSSCSAGPILRCTRATSSGMESRSVLTTTSRVRLFSTGNWCSAVLVPPSSTLVRLHPPLSRPSAANPHSLHRNDRHSFFHFRSCEFLVQSTRSRSLRPS